MVNMTELHCRTKNTILYLEAKRVELRTITELFFLLWQICGDGQRHDLVLTLYTSLGQQTFGTVEI